MTTNEDTVRICMDIFDGWTTGGEGRRWATERLLMMARALDDAQRAYDEAERTINTLREMLEMDSYVYRVTEKGDITEGERNE